MDESAPTLTGPLGSTIHVLRADAGALAELAAIDWNRHFRRVCLDPVRGVVTLMAPSHPHEDPTSIFDDVTEAVARVVRRRHRSSVRVSEEAAAYSAG